LKCTMTNAFTSARANRAKTEWRRDTDVSFVARATLGSARVSPAYHLIFRRFQFGEFFLRASHVRLLRAAEAKQFLLAP
jgi:hypothetical protein